MFLDSWFCHKTDFFLCVFVFVKWWCCASEWGCFVKNKNKLMQDGKNEMCCVERTLMQSIQSEWQCVELKGPKRANVKMVGKGQKRKKMKHENDTKIAAKLYSDNTSLFSLYLATILVLFWVFFFHSPCTQSQFFLLLFSVAFA